MKLRSGRSFRRNAFSLTSAAIESLETRTYFANLSFGPSTPITTAVGHDPTAIAVADFNNDGKADVIVGNSDFGNGDDVVVRLGNGDGTFHVGSNNTANGAVEAVAIGDFNGDGKIDAVSADGVSNTFSILIGSGDGTFSSINSTSLTEHVQAVAVGDFNHDGKLDLAFAQVQHVAIVLGNGNGTFQTPTLIALPPGLSGADAEGVAIADFNGDGKADLAVSDQANSTLLSYLGNGDGTFAAPTSVDLDGNGPVGIAVGDVNNDTNPDLAVSLTVGDTIAILVGAGDGTFSLASSATAPTGPHASVLADFNGDGNLDLVSSGTTSVTGVGVTGHGDGNFDGFADVFQGGESPGIAAADFNGDGKIDVACTDQNDGAVAVELNTDTDVPLVLSQDGSGIVTGIGSGFDDSVILTSSGAGQLTVVDHSVNQSFTGVTGINFNLGGGNDSLSAGASVAALIVQGGPGNDNISGTSNSDTLGGGQGTDIIRGLAGNDILRGGAGDDQLFGGQGDDQLFGGKGDDTLRGAHGNDQFTGALGYDSMFGGGEDDTFFAHDSLADTLDGGVGTNIAYVDSVVDIAANMTLTYPS